MLKICKYSLFESKTTEDLQDESDENPSLACTSKLHTWHKKGRGDSIHPQPVMDVVATKIRTDDENSSKVIKCHLYEARRKPKYNTEEVQKFKNSIASINPRMGIATLVSNPDTEMVETKFGHNPVGSTNSYQLSFTGANFRVNINISSVPRIRILNEDIYSYPCFPLKDFSTSTYPETVSPEEKTFLAFLEVDQNKINETELKTRDQADSEIWKEQRKFRFTASKFHVISKRVRNHETFANNIMNPKEFNNRHTLHGKRYEGTAIYEYQRFMNARKTPAVVLKCGLVISNQMPVLAATPDGKVIDFGCSKPFRIIEVKCPSTKSAVTPLEACADPKFFCHRLGEQCCLKTDHEYYAQVQGQLAITGAPWCDFVVYTFKGMSIQRITFDEHFWGNLRQKLESLFPSFHFICCFTVQKPTAKAKSWVLMLMT